MSLTALVREAVDVQEGRDASAPQLAQRIVCGHGGGYVFAEKKEVVRHGKRGGPGATARGPRCAFDIIFSPVRQT